MFVHRPFLSADSPLRLYSYPRRTKSSPMNQRCLRIVRPPLTGWEGKKARARLHRLRVRISRGQCVAKPFNGDNSSSTEREGHREEREQVGAFIWSECENAEKEGGRRESRAEGTRMFEISWSCCW